MGTAPWGGNFEQPELPAPVKSAAFLEPTFGRAARIWWAWVWRSIVFGGAAGLFGSVVLSLSGILERVSQKTAQVISAGVGVGLAIPVGIWVFQMILEKEFAEFQLRLVPKTPPAGSSTADRPA